MKKLKNKIKQVGRLALYLTVDVMVVGIALSGIAAIGGVVRGW